MVIWYGREFQDIESGGLNFLPETGASGSQVDVEDGNKFKKLRRSLVRKFCSRTSFVEVMIGRSVQLGTAPCTVGFRALQWDRSYAKYELRVFVERNVLLTILAILGEVRVGR